MLSERGLVRRAKAYGRAVESYLDKKDEVAEKLERITPISYYIDPKFEISTIDRVRRGILLVRETPGVAINSLCLAITGKRFCDAYAQSHPLDVPVPIPEALANVAAETVPPE